MTVRSLYPVLSTLAVVTVGTLGFIEGPLVALGVVGALIVVAAALMLVQRRDGGPPPRAVASALPPALEEDVSPFYRGLAPMVVLALLLRVVMVFLTNATELWMEFAPDSHYWMLSGAALLDHWRDPLVPLTPWFGSEDARPFYAVVNALLAAVFGASRYPPSLLNGPINVWAAFNFGRLAEMIYGREAGRWTFLGGLFFPSLMLWSSMNIREAWSFLVISFVLLSAHRLRQRFSPWDAALLLGSIAAMYSIRSYLVPLLFGGVVLSYLVVRVRQLPYALFSLALILVLAQSVGQNFGLDPAILSEDSLETVDELRRGLAYGGSAYGAEVDTRTVAGSLAYLPEGIARFLLGPYPWAVRSWRQMLTVPESLLWYWIVVLAGLALARDLRKRLTRVAPSFFVLLLVTAGYGLVSGNEGTAYRHRAQIMMIVFVFASSHPVFQRRRPARPAPA
ncbi:MAG: hypothetical protein H6730_14750 [Deltaproteobacteria bacterium]|nr:hypothetical protein [Deltaproteobacteria bacterium]